MPLRSVAVSAPGKCILHGEHAVVYGKEALAAALDLRTSVTLKPAATGLIHLRMPALEIDEALQAEQLPPAGLEPPALDAPPYADEAYVRALAHMVGSEMAEDGSLPARALAMVTFLYLYDAIRKLPAPPSLEAPATAADPDPGVEVNVDSMLPIGAGLGSSAAFCVCLSASLLGGFGHVGGAKGELSEGDRVIVNKWALYGEKVVHGNPSGLDNTMSVYGGAVTYVAGKFAVLDNFPSLRVLLVNTKVPRSTRALVAGVRVLKDKHPAVMSHVLDGTGALSTEARELYSQLHRAQKHGDLAEVQRLETLLSELIILNQHLLAAMGVSHPALAKVVAIAQEHGVHAKLTGAGGGGCALVYLPQSRETDDAALCAALEAAGFETWLTQLGNTGLTLTVA